MSEIFPEIFESEFYGLIVYGKISEDKAALGVLYTSSGSNGFFMFTGDQARLVAKCLPEEDQKVDGEIDEVYTDHIGQELWENILDIIRSVKNEAETT